MGFLHKGLRVWGFVFFLPGLGQLGTCQFWPSTFEMNYFSTAVGVFRKLRFGSCDHESMHLSWVFFRLTPCSVELEGVGLSTEDLASSIS